MFLYEVLLLFFCKLFIFSKTVLKAIFFENIRISSGNEVMVKWLKNNKDESLESYAKRIISKYNITNQDLVVGLSFGGLIAQQIAELIGSKQVILISSFRTKESPRILRQSAAFEPQSVSLSPDLKICAESGVDIAVGQHAIGIRAY